MSEVRRTQAQRVAESTSRLLNAAAEVLVEGGYEALTAAEIGRRAGYSRSMVRARFGSTEALVDALLRGAYESPLTAELPQGDTGLAHVLARLDIMHRLVEERPELMRVIFSVEFQAAGRATGMRARVAAWIISLREDLRAAIERGQRDGSIRPDVNPEVAAHAIVVEGVGSAFLWTLDPDEEFGRRITEWRTHAEHRLRAL